jgi:low temperature requirement protein LtrA
MARRARTVAVGEESKVTSIELFFDLVFVFALTQVTALMAEDLTARGAIRGILVVSVLWWCWVGYAWLGNLVRADEGVMRVALFVAMSGMFVAALTIPESFDDFPGGLSGPVVFAVCYFVVRATHFAMFWAASKGDAGLRRQLVRFIPGVLVGTSLLLVASQLSGTAQTLMWLAALAGDYLGTVLAGASGWRINSAGHFAERHGLIIIIALGESIVSIGVGVTELPISWPIIVASVLGLTIAGALWWSYFDVVALVAERVLARLQGAERAKLARDSYSFLHLPMVIGIIFLSLGLKKVLNYVGGADGHTLTDPLYGLPLIALYGGTSLYLLAHVAFRWRNTHTVNPHRTVVAVLLLALIPVGALMPALATLGLLAAVLVALICYESIRYASARNAVRHEDDIVTP